MLYVQDEVVCRTEYQKGGQGLLCACQTFAIGRCAECGEPVCGIHSEVLQDVRLCRVHLAAEREKLDHARHDDERTKLAEREDAWCMWEDRVVSDLAGTPPVERIIRFLRVLPIDELEDQMRRPAPRRPGLGKAVRELLPDLWSGDLLAAPPWEHDEVHAWLEATIPPRPTNVAYLKPRGLLNRAILGKGKGWDEWQRAPAHGWIVNLAPPKPGNTSIATFMDGRRGMIDMYGHCTFGDPAPGFNVYAMWNLGELAQLPDLSAPPELLSRYACWRLWGNPYRTGE